MNVEKAKNSFLEAKGDLSPRTLEQYSHALDYLERACPKMPKKPEPLRKALNEVQNAWVLEMLFWIGVHDDLGIWSHLETAGVRVGWRVVEFKRLDSPFKFLFGNQQ